jgi:hypothetical protein
VVVRITGIDYERGALHLQPERLFGYTGKVDDHFYFVAERWTSATGSSVTQEREGASSAISAIARSSPLSRTVMRYLYHCGEPVMNFRSIREKRRENISSISSNISRGFPCICFTLRDFFPYVFPGFFSRVSVIFPIAAKSFLRAKVSLRSS